MMQNEPSSPRLIAALRYAEAGIPVFPCVVNGKNPAVPRGFYAATTDPEVIKKWWAEADYNIGLYLEPAGLCVIDVDGIDGRIWLEGANLPPTFTVATPSGGFHLYYKGSLPSTASRLAPSVDTRGRGSYVLAPPSVIDGREYWVAAMGDAAGLPTEIGTQLNHEHPRLEAPEHAVIDSEWMLDLAREELQALVAKGDVAVEGQGGDDRTYRLAAHLFDMGLSQGATADLINTFWAPYCDPPWEPEQVETIVGHAWRYKLNEHGCRALPDPASWNVEQYPPPPEPEPEPTYPSFSRASEVAKRPPEPIEWLWEDRIPLNMGTLLMGDGGAGKTTALENLAVAIAAGLPLWGKETTKRPVYMIVGEDTEKYVTNNLEAIAEFMDAPQGALDNIHVISTLQHEISGGHTLAQITEDGGLSDTPFMRHIASQLVAGCVLMVDPLAEFVEFDRNKDAAARALGTGWVRALNRAGITVIISDHPSTAGMARGDYVGGSRHMRSGFAVHAALIAEDWIEQHRNMVFSFKRIRYAAEHNIELVRGASPAFFEHGGPKHTPTDCERAVYRHAYGRLQFGGEINVTDRGDHGPSEIVIAISTPERRYTKEAVKDALTALCIRRWLAKGDKGYRLGPDAPDVDEMETGLQ